MALPIEGEASLDVDRCCYCSAILGSDELEVCPPCYDRERERLNGPWTKRLEEQIEPLLKAHAKLRDDFLVLDKSHRSQIDKLRDRELVIKRMDELLIERDKLRTKIKSLETKYLPSPAKKETLHVCARCIRYAKAILAGDTEDARQANKLTHTCTDI